jgi:hypothetical protein
MWTRTVTFQDETGSRTYMDGWVSDEQINRALAKPAEPRKRTYFGGYVVFLENDESGPLFRGWNAWVWPKDQAFVFPTLEAAMKRLSQDREDGLPAGTKIIEIWAVTVVPMESMTYDKLEYHTEVQ